MMKDPYKGQSRVVASYTIIEDANHYTLNKLIVSNKNNEVLLSADTKKCRASKELQKVFSFSNLDHNCDGKYEVLSEQDAEFFLDDLEGVYSFLLDQSVIDDMINAAQQMWEDSLIPPQIEEPGPSVRFREVTVRDTEANPKFARVYISSRWGQELCFRVPSTDKYYMTFLMLNEGTYLLGKIDEKDNCFKWSGDETGWKIKTAKSEHKYDRAVDELFK